MKSNNKRKNNRNKLKINKRDIIDVVMGIIILILIVVSLLLFLNLQKVMHGKNTLIDLKVKNQIVCRKKLDVNNGIDVIKVNIGSYGEVKSYQLLQEFTYDEKTYKEVKDAYQPMENIKTTFDDKNHTMTYELNETELKNEEGEQIDTWYKDFLHSYTTQGYTCDE